MSNTSQTKQGGIGFLGILALIFITLKLMGYIKWSWLWVLGPIWIPFALVGVLFVIAGLLSLAGHILRQRENKKRIQQKTIVSNLDRRR
jgi:uncharacterized integral membrane protein